MSQEELWNALLDNDYEQLKEYLEDGRNPDTTDDDGVSLLDTASMESNIDSNILQLLIDYGANVNYVNKHGYTPLYFAARESFEKTKMLIDAGADLSIKYNGKTIFKIVEEYVYRLEKTNPRREKDLKEAKKILKLLKPYFNVEYKNKQLRRNPLLTMNAIPQLFDKNNNINIPEWRKLCANVDEVELPSLIDLFAEIYRRDVLYEGYFKNFDKKTFDKKIKRLLCYFFSNIYTEIQNNQDLNEFNYPFISMGECETHKDANDKKVDLGFVPFDETFGIYVHSDGKHSWCFSYNDVKSIIDWGIRTNPFNREPFSAEDLENMRIFQRSLQNNPLRKIF